MGHIRIRADTLTPKSPPARSGRVQSMVVVRSNDLTFVEEVVARLRAAGIVTWLFGGWAEELLELVPPRLHRDLDLLHLAADFQLADGFMTADSQATEITAKRFAHKRAFLHDGIMVELILVQATRPGGFCTLFWGDTLHQWPDDLFTVRVGALRVASATSLREYRASHSRLAWSPERARPASSSQRARSCLEPAQTDVSYGDVLDGE
jgi:hypothetical protein